MKKNQLNKYLRFVNIAFQMSIIITAGVFLGRWLDQEYPNKFSGFTIFFSLFGVFTALYQVMRSLNGLDKEE